MSELGTLRVAVIYVGWDGKAKQKTIETVHGITYQLACEVAKDIKASNGRINEFVISYQADKNYL